MLVTASALSVTLSIAFIFVCLFMVLIVLIQKPKGGGLAGAFGGGGGGSQAVFGAKVGDVLTWVTVSCFILFIALAISLIFLTRSEAKNTALLGSDTPTTQVQPTTTDSTETTTTPITPTTEQGNTVEEVEEAVSQDAETQGVTEKVTEKPDANEKVNE